MKILFIGDTHGSVNIDKIRPSVFEKLDLGADDIIIHLGDIGVPWVNTQEEAYQYWLSLPCQIIVCLGNHENYDWIEQQPLIEKYGVPGYQMGHNLFAPRIGSIIELGGKSFWFYPGGYSIDFSYRTLGTSIWKQELPLKEDSDRALENLKNKGHVNYIISHDGPKQFIKRALGYEIRDTVDSYLIKTETIRGDRVHPALVLDEIYSKDELYDHWYFGHHHQDWKLGKVRCVMHDMILWDSDTDETKVIPYLLNDIGIENINNI